MNLPSCCGPPLSARAASIEDTELRVGVGLIERAGLLARYADAPAGVTVIVKGRMLTEPDAEFERFCAACDVGPGRRSKAR